MIRTRDHQPRLTIHAGDRLILDEVLTAGLNRYMVPMVAKWYVLTASDCHGEIIYMEKLPAEELLEHRCGDDFKPLVIYRDGNPDVFITPEGLTEPSISQGIFGRVTIPAKDSTDQEDYQILPVVRDICFYPFSIMDSIQTFAPMACYFTGEFLPGEGRRRFLH